MSTSTTPSTTSSTFTPLFLTSAPTSGTKTITGSTFPSIYHHPCTTHYIEDPNILDVKALCAFTPDNFNTSEYQKCCGSEPITEYGPLWGVTCGTYACKVGSNDTNLRENLSNCLQNVGTYELQCLDDSYNTSSTGSTTAPAQSASKSPGVGAAVQAPNAYITFAGVLTLAVLGLGGLSGVILL